MAKQKKQQIVLQTYFPSGYQPSQEEAFELYSYEQNTGNTLTRAYSVVDSKTFFDALDFELRWFKNEEQRKIEEYTQNYIQVMENHQSNMASIDAYLVYISTKKTQQ